jgi:hypothetical protein
MCLKVLFSIRMGCIKVKGEQTDFKPRNQLEITRNQWNHLKSPKSPKSPEIIWNHLKSPEIARNHLKSLEITAILYTNIECPVWSLSHWSIFSANQNSTTVFSLIVQNSHWVVRAKLYRISARTKSFWHLSSSTYSKRKKLTSKFDWLLLIDQSELRKDFLSYGTRQQWDSVSKLTENMGL